MKIKKDNRDEIIKICDELENKKNKFPKREKIVAKDLRL